MFSSAPVDTSSLSVEQPHSFQINFNSLYTALCEQQRSDQATLLLYTLLHQNTNMRTYMLSRTDMDNLVGGTAVKTAAHPLFLSQSDVLSVVFWQNKSKKTVKNESKCDSSTKHNFYSLHTWEWRRKSFSSSQRYGSVNNRDVYSGSWCYSVHVGQCQLFFRAELMYGGI